MEVSLLLFVLIGLAFVVVMIVAVPVGLVAMATSPDVQRTVRRAGVAILPLAVIGAGLLAVLSTAPVRVEQHPPPQEVAMPQQLISEVPVVLAETPAIASATKTGNESSTTSSPLSDSTQPVAITSFDANSDVPQTVDTLPAWVSAWKNLPDSHLTEQLVLTSRRYASVEEAEQELLATLRPRLGAYLRRHAMSVDLALVTPADLRRTEAILGRVHEQFLVDLGSSQEPVYRVTWQVWLRPSVRDAFAADDRLAERDERLLQLGLGAGLLTLLFGTWAAYFRIDDRTQGRYRGRLKAAAIASTLAGAAVTLLA